MCVERDLSTPDFEDEIHIIGANDFANGTVGGLRERGFRLRNVEQEVLRHEHAILDGVGQVDQVFITGQHAAGIFQRAYAADVHRLQLFDGLRQSEFQPGVERAVIFAKPKHDPAFGLVNDVNRTPGDPDHQQKDNQADYGRERPAARAALAAAAVVTTAAAHDLFQAPLHVGKYFIQIGWLLAIAPFPGVSVTAATTAASGFIPGH